MYLKGSKQEPTTCLWTKFSHWLWDLTVRKPPYLASRIEEGHNEFQCFRRLHKCYLAVYDGIYFCHSSITESFLPASSSALCTDRLQPCSETPWSPSAQGPYPRSPPAALSTECRECRCSQCRNLTVLRLGMWVLMVRCSGFELGSIFEKLCHHGQDTLPLGASNSSSANRINKIPTS